MEITAMRANSGNLDMKSEQVYGVNVVICLLPFPFPSLPGRGANLSKTICSAFPRQHSTHPSASQRGRMHRTKDVGSMPLPTCSRNHHWKRRTPLAAS